MTNPLRIQGYLLLLITVLYWAGGSLLADRPYTEENGKVIPRQPSIPAQLKNHDWPREAEEAMMERFQALVTQATERRPFGRGYREQNARPLADQLLLLFSDYQQRSLKILQSGELEGEAHEWTEGIDFYWSVTLPSKIRKYFYFRDLLEPDYRQRMYYGARRWTEDEPRPGLDLINHINAKCPVASAYAKEVLQKMGARWSSHFESPGPPAEMDQEDWQAWWIPLLQEGWQSYEEKERLLNPFPHPRFDRGTGPVGRKWSPSARGMRVDPRNTQNRRLMRDTSIYLMAEETGNERVQKLYREKLREQISLLYEVGFGDWDSDAYLEGVFAAFHNLYDFALDKEVIALGKAALDWHYTAAALKYRRGHFGGPAKQTTSENLGNYLAFVFGNYPDDKDLTFSRMALFPATSAYRPPAATLALARQEIPPAEILSTKPSYSPSLPSQSNARQTFETLYIGSTFTLGTVNSRVSDRSTRRWHLAIDHPTKGAVPLLINSGNHPQRNLRASDQIAQMGKAVIWLRPNNGRSLSFDIPEGAEGRIYQDFWILDIEGTWIAIRPIGLKTRGLRPFLQNDGGERFLLRQVPTHDTPYIGFAMEIGNRESHGSLSRFTSNISQIQEIDLSQLAEGKVEIFTSKGLNLSLQHREGDLPFIRKHGETVEWAEQPLWQSFGNNGPISLDRDKNILSITAGGHSFETQFPEPKGKAE